MNKSPREILDFAKEWLMENADQLPLEIRVLIYRAMDDIEKENK